MIQNKREIIKTEIDSLKRAVDKHAKDYRIITVMINDLIDNRDEIVKEVVALTKMAKDRTDELESME